MENKIYNDDVERIVNDPERQETISKLHQKMKIQKQRKMFRDAAICAVLCLAIGKIGSSELMVNWIAFPLCAGFGIYGSFCLGRWFENGKCCGWH